MTAFAEAMPSRPSRFAVFSRGLRDLAGLPSFLGGEILYRPGPGRVDAVVCWGRKATARPAEAYVRRHGLPLLRLEDGFLRSVGLGGDDPPLSVVADDLGIYYDATGPSRLETTIAAPLDAAASDRARALAAAWRQGRLSKYNHSRDDAAALPERYVLVADQTRGDAAIGHGLADESSFRRMLAAALDEHPDCPILLKVHPEVFAGRKRGYFDRLDPGLAGRVRLLGRDVHPAGLLAGAAAVYTVTSQLGFEALLWGRPVRTFGMPFYAGWGLTGDDLAPPSRRRSASLEALVHAALVDYPRYLDPETGRPCQVERIMDHLAFQRRMRQRFPAEVHGVGIVRLRRSVARAYFAGSALRYHASPDTAPEGATLAVWGRPAEGAATVAVEDGFLRSVGLGAELARPISLAMDRVGIYYDATRPSELEQILQRTRFDPDLIARAAALREGIVAAGLTKYNVGAASWRRPAGAGRVALATGQVETDASLRFGSPAIRTNLELLASARAVDPDAYLVYKPHPEVQAGLRHGGADLKRIRTFCDEVVWDVPMDTLLDQVDEVHVMTSLSGFEALLRRKSVVCHGQPFYAGWGLTRDLSTPARRDRRLSLDELVAGALILYPVYLSRVTGHFTSPEQALAELTAWRGQAATGEPALRRIGRMLLRRIVALRNRGAYLLAGL